MAIPAYLWKWLVLFPFLFTLCSCSSNSDEQYEQKLFKKIMVAIKKENTRDISDDEYDRISEYISQGKNQWVNLYPSFNKEPFTGVTEFQEGLNISMAYALTKKPSVVLKFINEENIEYICGIPFIEPTQSEIDQYYIKTRTEIMADKSGSPWKEKCLLIMDNRVTKVMKKPDRPAA